jgi:hypothetical protein
MSAYGYEPPWTGIIEAQPGSLELHALITPTERLNLTRRRHTPSPTLGIFNVVQ